MSNDNAITRNTKRQLLQELRVASAARVDTFKRSVGRVVANLMTRLVTTGLQPSDEPAAQQVPVLFPGGGGYTFAFDMRQGDPALLVCADGPVHGFWETGEAVTPQTSAGHDYGCSMAIPGGRVSAEATPTEPPNAEGEGFIGATDGSACVIFRGAGLPSPTELGTVVVAAAHKVLLGADTATLGVVRLGDAVAPTADMATFMAAVGAAINVLVPGTVAPPILAAIALQIGTSSEASTDVLST
jgi:hypothetical protein